jgi:hypothetical protein
MPLPVGATELGGRHGATIAGITPPCRGGDTLARSHRPLVEFRIVIVPSL